MVFSVKEGGCLFLEIGLIVVLLNIFFVNHLFNVLKAF